ncbi:MAG: hypothetical protein E7425_01225 [Ruminococcaceae bacterium]|nr:hypothetical protein [Oscillospiraceae bacterium]
MAKQPFYHLRPNKNIDRSLFIQTLTGLSRHYPISNYHYIGFGSYLFDDFKLLHESLNISKMVSLEMDPLIYKRAKFNVPYNCIHIENTNSTDYLSELELEDKEHYIFWLDFVSPKDLGSQLSDYATLINLLRPLDIVRITLNASPAALGNCDDPDKQLERRLDKLKERVDSAYLPSSIQPSAVTTAEYPITLLRILKAVSLKLLEGRPPYSPNFMFPLFSSIYEDGQQMLTFTGIVLDDHAEEKYIIDSLSDYPHNTFKWDEPCKIEIPALTVREITELNKLLPNQDVRQQIINDFPFIFSEKEPEIVDSYISYYKLYPHYHQVNF